MSKEFVWRITKYPNEDTPRLETGKLLENIPEKLSFPIIADSLLKIASFLFNVTIYNNDLDNAETKVKETESIEYEFE